jgi:hypothetical protein
MTALPPPIMTSEIGSFARKTIEELKPGIIDNLLNQYDYPPQIQKALLDLKSEMINGQLKPLQEQTSDRAIWDLDVHAYIGKSWLNIPWILAETFFFRRFLEAVQYFQPGPWQGRDPFQHLKNRELLTALPEFINTFQNKSTSNDESAFQEACYQSLWGNQSDLSNLESYNVILSHPEEKLVIDHSEQAFEFISHQNGKLAYFFDNVGKELYFDLAFIDLLFQRDLAQSVTCYLKNQPFFVSDALPKDLYQAIDLMASSSDLECEHLALRIGNGLKSGRIRIEAPPFLATSRTFRRMPDALKREIGQHDIAILKGDVNFRKLVGDRHWDPTTAIDKAAGYFPTSFLSLRTLKGELIVGLEKDQIHNLESNAGDNWMINGKRGMITFLQNKN